MVHPVQSEEHPVHNLPVEKVFQYLIDQTMHKGL
jgi:hypothetical protein